MNYSMVMLVLLSGVVQASESSSSSRSSSSSSSSVLGKRKCSGIVVNGKVFDDPRDALKKVAKRLEAVSTTRDDRPIEKEKELRVQVNIDGRQYYIWMIDITSQAEEKVYPYFVSTEGKVSCSRGGNQAGWGARFEVVENQKRHTSSKQEAP